eukprot:s546_g10.t1
MPHPWTHRGEEERVALTKLQPTSFSPTTRGINTRLVPAGRPLAVKIHPAEAVFVEITRDVVDHVLNHILRIQPYFWGMIWGVFHTFSELGQL